MAISKIILNGQTQMDVTHDTVTASTLMSGETAHDASGTQITGTASGATLVTKNITANGTYNATLDDADGYSSVTVNVPSGGGESATEKQINFIDYDGTILHSYTKTEWQSVSTLPSNPSHSGLTAQGWNWTKAQIDAQLTAIPDGVIWVGQMYVTDDGKTRIYIHLEEGRLHPYLGICPNGTVIVDWGDNSSTSTLTGTSLTTVQHADHTYASSGDYMITLTVSSGSFAFYGVSNTAHILKKNTTTTANIHYVYTNAIQKIEIGNNASIGNYAFLYCLSLASITIPSGVTNIGNYAFRNCYSLASITIPSTVTSIGSYAFWYCQSLVSITIPSGVTNIGTYAFYNCQSLVSITIPSGMTNIGNYTFQSCPSLVSITIPNTVTSIDSSAFNGCSSLASITIPSRVTSIGTSAFSSCSSLASITIPSTVTSIDSNTFQNCPSLVSITIPSEVTNIGNYAFQNCYSLASITIPSGVTSIGSYAFHSCYGMAEYHFLPITPPTLSTYAFTNIQSDCKIYVPSASLEDYQTATNWSAYASYMVGE